MSKTPLIYTTSKELRGKTLQIDDIVYFRDAKGHIVHKYTVKRSFLNRYGGGNDAIFDDIEANKKQLAINQYGYAPNEMFGSKDFPEYKIDDFDAITRLVMRIFMIIEGDSHLFGGEIGAKTTDKNTTQSVNLLPPYIMSGISSVVRIIREASKTEPEKTLYNAGLIDIDNSITDEGKAALVEVLFQQNKDKLKEVAELIIAARK